MESDMHNLQPAIGGGRPNKRFMYSQAGRRREGRGWCAMKVDFKASSPVRASVAPPIYMRDRHQLKLSRQQTRLLNVWDKRAVAALGRARCAYREGRG